MNVAIYIQGERIDLFQDEKIELNLSVKNLSDISSVISDFSQSFSVPSSPNNNRIFTHWYNADVDGTYNANLRQDAYIEVNTLPFKYGTIQLDKANLKSGIVDSYSLTFFGKGVNLSDLFAEDLLSDLDLFGFDHSYNSTTVLNSMNSDEIASGDVYYPFINAVRPMSIGSGVADDLLLTTNEITYTDFKPAIRCIKIIQAIENKYNVVFSRDFFGRAVFHNLFLWLHKEEGYLKAFGQKVDINIITNASGEGFNFNATTNSVTYTAPSNSRTTRSISIKVIPQSGFTTVPYQIEIYNNGILSNTVDGINQFTATYSATGNNVISYKIASAYDFSFTTKITGKERVTGTPIGVDTNLINNTTALQSITSTVKISEQMPEMKVKDFFKSLISMFNLIIKFDKEKFVIDTLDNWYSKGKAYDITHLVDIKDIQIKRPDVKKEIEFTYKKSSYILGDRYLTNNNVGYGDLKAKYNVDGSELKVESSFENLMLERLNNETTGDLSDIQVGYAIDKNLKATKGAPILIYKNGYAYSDAPLKVKPTGNFTKIQHTATEDNIDFEQVTNSLNFGADNSTFFQYPIEKSLYFNFWKTYIEDLYNKKTRVINFKCKLPSYILYNLVLNDRFIVNDKKYKISNIKVDITSGDADVELFTDFSKPFDSVENLIPITVDRTDITVDNTEITVDSISEYDPVTSYTLNGLSITNYLGTASEEHFELKISANTTWAISKIDTGSGTNWFETDKLNGDKSEYIRVTINKNTSAYREGIVRVLIASTTYDLLIQQQI